MNKSVESEGAKKGSKGPSRQVIEELCLIGAVGSGGCTVHELTDRLGLSPLLAEVVEKSARTLELQGYLSFKDGHIYPTEPGRVHYGKFVKSDC
jgi:hypothetical protein